MGGSGGGFFSRSSNPETLARKTREEEEKSQSREFDASVAEFLGAKLSEFNDRDVEGIQKILDEVMEELGEEVEGSIDLLFGGSVAKFTYVNGLSDVDTLVLLNDTDLSGKEPREVRNVLAELLESKYGKDNVRRGELAVTLTVGTHEVQMIPAVRFGEHFQIPRLNGVGWSRIDPKGFAKALTKANQRLDGKLIPTIKLAKAIIGNLPEKHQISGYHAESLAIEVFREYDGPNIPKAMLKRFFENGSDRIKSPIQDKSGQSVHVDEYLGKANSIERRIVADAFARLSRKIKNADGAKSLDSWNALFE